MQKKLFVYSAFIAITMISGCTLEPLDAYEGTPCPNVHRLITKIDYGLPNGTHVEVYCNPRSIDSYIGGTCDDYITHDFVNDDVSHDAEGQMIFALNSGLCPKSYLCQDNGTCVKSLCNGFNTNLDSDNANCGKCGYKCGNGTTCSNGVCIVADKSKVLCNGEFINPENDPRYCGARGDCKDDNPVSWDYRGIICQGATPVCSNGRCVSACVGGQIVCDGRCVDPQTDMNYCGARGDCIGFNAGEKCTDGRICSGGSCGVTCVSGQIVCDGRCVDPMTDNRYCGATGDCSNYTACPSGTVCSGGICDVTCPSGQILCNGRCIDPKSDNHYCGASGNCIDANSGSKCKDGEVCSGGKCGITCVSGQIVCNGQCIDPNSDNRYCGAIYDCIGANIGKMCTNSHICIAGKCTLICPNNQILCFGDCIDPESAGDYCGAKGACNNSDPYSVNFYGEVCGVKEVCTKGKCELNSCYKSSETLCEIDKEKKCININSDDANNCGACGYKCADHPIANATATGCSAGICQYKCINNTENVGSDNTAANIRCVDTSTDVNNCGGKGNKCESGQVCVNSICVQNSCVAPLVLCSTKNGNQCININEADENNCGACGYKCADHPVANAVSEKCLYGQCIYECKSGYANQGTGNTASEILCVGSAS